MGIFSFFKRNKEVEQEQKQELDKGLEKTRASVFDVGLALSMMLAGSLVLSPSTEAPKS